MLHVRAIESQKCAFLAGSAKYIHVIYTIGYLKIFQTEYFLSKKHCHDLQEATYYQGCNANKKGVGMNPKN